MQSEQTESGVSIRENAKNLLVSRSFAFATLSFFCAATLWLFLLIYRNIEEIFGDMWGSPEDWYLKEFRPTAAWVWSLTRAFTASSWTLAFPTALLIAIGAANARLSRDHARTLDLVVAFAWFAVLVIASVCLANLMMLPLVLGGPG